MERKILCVYSNSDHLLPNFNGYNVGKADNLYRALKKIKEGNFGGAILIDVEIASLKGMGDFSAKNGFNFLKSCKERGLPSIVLLDSENPFIKSEVAKLANKVINKRAKNFGYEYFMVAEELFRNK